MTERLACGVAGFTAADRRRHAALVSELARSVTGVQELPDGYAFRFPARPFLFVRLAEWIDLERACCPFLKIALELGRESREYRVSISGPEGAKDVIASELPKLVTVS